MKKKDLYQKTFILILLSTVISCAKSDYAVFINTEKKGYNEKTLDGCELNDKENHFEKKVIKPRQSNDIRITPCYWIDSLCYGIIDIDYRTEISSELLPVFIDKNGDVFQLSNETKTLNTKILNSDEVLERLAPLTSADSNFIKARIETGRIYFGINRLMSSNIDSIIVLKEYYVQEW